MTPPPPPPTWSTNISHKSNPDIVRNTNGNKLLEILSQIKSFHILNGLQYYSLKCDSEFTFFRGKLCSQNDIALSNCIESIVYFQIHEKNIYSDHKPCSVELKMNPKISLDIVDNCSANTFSYDHYDINRKMITPIKISQINVKRTVEALKTLAHEISVTLSNVELDSNECHLKCHLITEGIYKSCQNNRCKFSVNNIGAIPNHENCTSKNFAAIAEANFARYEQLLLDGRDEAEYNEFLERWQDAQFLAINHKKSEFNTCINTNWQRCQNDKQLWEAIDWKGKSIVYQSTDISPTN